MTIPFIQSRPRLNSPSRYLVSLVILVLGFAGCGEKKVERVAKPVPESAKMLLEPSADTADAVLLHTVDTATEFPMALGSLEPDAIEPEVRAVQELPPATSASGETVEQAVEIVESSTVRASTPLNQDWGGVILVPDMDRMSRGFTSRVTLTRIEAHPIANDHFRVWVRVRNDEDKDIEADVACNFRALDQEAQETEFIPIKIAKGGSANAYFISPMPNVAYYTILVR